MDIEFYRHYSNSLGSGQGPPWRYDEMKPGGVNYNSFFLAGMYDARHEMFRDFEREAGQIVQALGLNSASTVIDMGCGTGAFAIPAARHCGTVHAVDVSKAMLSRARRKARKAGATNVQFHHGGFLTYEHEDEPADAIVSVAVLHHLPDFWKLAGLHRAASMLKPGGRLYLFDVVLSFDVSEYESRIEGFINAMRMRMGNDGADESQTHFRQEYSTCNWVMEGLLQTAGFRIDNANYVDDFLAGYVCTKQNRPATSS